MQKIVLIQWNGFHILVFKLVIGHGLLQDLFAADNQSILTPTHYLSFAYRTQARMITELFYWFPYNSQFVNTTQQLFEFNETRATAVGDENSTRWYPK